MNTFFVRAKSVKKAIAIIGGNSDFAKIVKVQGGFMFYKYIEDFNRVQVIAD